MKGPNCASTVVAMGTALKLFALALDALAPKPPKVAQRTVWPIEPCSRSWSGKLMNSLLLLPEEFVDNTEAVLRAERALHAINTHALKPGLRVRACVLGKGRGEIDVLNVSPSEVRVSYRQLLVALPRTPVDVIVAVPRPQTVKKVLQFAAMTGLRSVHFVRSERVEKSYMDAGIWQPQMIARELYLGIEQSYDSQLPQIQLHSLFKPFVEDFLPALLKEERTSLLVAETQHDLRQPLKALMQGEANRFVVALGPEAGWNSFEISKFLAASAALVDLGPRILRVEIALGMLVGQIEALRGEAG